MKNYRDTLLSFLIVLAVLVPSNYLGKGLWAGQWIQILTVLCLGVLHSLGPISGPLFFVPVFLAGSIATLGMSPSADLFFTSFAFLMILFFFALFRLDKDKIFFKASHAISHIGPWILAYQYFYGDVNDSLSFGGYSSMSAGLLVTLFPLSLKCLDFKKWGLFEFGYLSGITFWAVILSGSSMPYFQITAMIGVYILSFREWAPLKLVAVGAPIATGLLLLGPELYTSNDRLRFWSEILQWWYDSGQWFTGLGNGTAQMIFPNKSPTGYPWAHNDFIQILFENGILGLLSVLYFVWYLFKRSKRHLDLRAAFVSFLVCAFFNMPLHIAPHALFGAFIMWEILQLDLRGVEG